MCPLRYSCRIALVAVFLLSGSGLHAEIVPHRGISFHIYRHDPANGTLELWLAKEGGKPNTFTEVEARAKASGKELLFALNAGIFEPDFLPTGLHVSEGKTVKDLNLQDHKKQREGEFTPNFYLKPNGVFFVRPDGTAGVYESKEYARAGESVRIATQSGPLLVWDGKIHPVLTEDSTSVRYRNGVGVTPDGEIIFACSVLDVEKGMSNLHNFATLFRDKLNCPDALYLDGDISYIYLKGETPPITKTNWFGGIFVVTRPQP